MCGYYKMAKKRGRKTGKETDKKTGNGWIYENFLESVKYLKNIKNYFWFSLILFAVIGVLSFIFPLFFEKEILGFIQDLIERTRGMNSFELTGFIIYNNIKSALFAVVFGIFFGVIPFLITVVNAYVLGFVSSRTVAAAGHWVLWRLVPHGIFEIPAVLISVALGIRLGMFLFVYKGGNKKKEYWEWVKDSLRVFLFIIIPLLVIAGIIEGFLVGVVG